MTKSKQPLKVKPRIDKITGEAILFFPDHPDYTKNEVRIMSWSDTPAHKESRATVLKGPRTRHKERDMDYYKKHTRNPIYRGEEKRVERLLSRYDGQNELQVMERLKTPNALTEKGQVK